MWYDSFCTCTYELRMKEFLFGFSCCLCLRSVLRVSFWYWWPKETKCVHNRIGCMLSLEKKNCQVFILLNLCKHSTDLRFVRLFFLLSMHSLYDSYETVACYTILFSIFRLITALSCHHFYVTWTRGSCTERHQHIRACSWITVRLCWLVLLFKHIFFQYIRFDILNAQFFIIFPLKYIARILMTVWTITVGTKENCRQQVLLLQTQHSRIQV